MTVFIGIVNQKGGVGKTTSAVNFAAIAARFLGSGQVALIDADSQANATLTFLGPEIAFADRNPNIYTLMDVLEKRCTMAQAVHAVALPEVAGLPAVTLDVIPSRIEMADKETDLNTGYNLFTFRDAAVSLQGKYQVVFVDCPPNVGGVTRNVLLMCSHLIVPVIPGTYEFSGLRSLLATVENARRLNPTLRIIGVLPTRVKRHKFAEEVIEALELFFHQSLHDDGLMMPQIPDRVAVERNKDIVSAEPSSDAAQQYIAATQELLVRAGVLEAVS